MPLDAKDMVPSLWDVLLKPSPTNTYPLGSTSLAFSNLFLGPNGAPVFDPTTGNIGFFVRTAAEIAASITPPASGFVYPPGDVRRYGADPTGSADSTTAFSNALLVALQMNSTAGFVHAPAGTYKIVSQLTIGERCHLYGDGKYATKLLFVPTVNSTCIQIKNASTECDQGSLQDLCIYSNDSTFTKIAIDAVDLNSWTIQRVSIGGSIVVSSTSYWSGANSIGIQSRGRQANSYMDIDIAADRPLVIAKNPNSTISIDHTNFHNLYLIANGHPVVEILDGVNLTQVTFSGYQAWVLGTDGFFWSDTTTTIVSTGLKLQNIRWEQGTNSASHLVNISHNTALQELSIENCAGGADRNGYILRKCSTVKFDSVYFTGGATHEALNVDSTVTGITGINCFWQAGSTATITGQRLIFGTPPNPNTGALPPNFIYDASANANESITFNGALSQDVFTVVNNGTTGLGATTTCGVLTVASNSNEVAIFSLNGTNNSTSKLQDPLGVYTVTAGTAASINIYWSAGNSRYELENKRGASRNFKVSLLGTYSSF